MHVNECTATVQAEENGDVVAMTKKTATADAITVETPPSTAATTAPFATRTRKRTMRTMLMLHRSVPNGNVFPMRGVPTFRSLIEHPIERVLSGCVDDGKSGRQSYDYVPVQEASEITKQAKLAGDTIIIDTITPHHIVPAESELCQHVVNEINCCMRVRGSCGLASARKKGTHAFRARNDGGKLVPIHLEKS